VRLAPAALALLLAAPAAAQQTVYVRQAAPAWLGISYDLLWVEHGGTCHPEVVVASVIQGSPAERAGLRAGDAIVSLDGEPIPAGRLQAIASRLAPGDSVRIQVQRRGATREVTAVADRRPDRPLSIFMETPGPGGSTAPVVELVGDTLIARNLAEWTPARARGYWVRRGDGRAEYHAISTWARSDLDQRVVDLLACADSAQAQVPVWDDDPDPVRINLRRLQERADSLRAVITRRALERQDVEGFITTAPVRRFEPGVGQPTVQFLGPGGAFYFRAEDPSAGPAAVAGAQVTALEPDLAAYFRNAERGLLVLRIAPDSPADRAGLRPGDVVTAAGGRRLESVAELARIIALPDAGDVELRVIRHGRSRALTLRRD
jgi:membrane-associated protease RseP (regulator of RpoE activity)